MRKTWEGATWARVGVVRQEWRRLGRARYEVHAQEYISIIKTHIT